MEQIHRRFTAEQVKLLLKAYCQGTLDRPAVQETLGIGKARFFALLKQYFLLARDVIIPSLRSYLSGVVLKTPENDAIGGLKRPS